MIVSDVVTRVRRTFGDEASVQVQDDDIIRWINDAQEHIIMKNEGLMEATAQANIVQNQQIYDVPTDMSVLRSLKYNGFRLKPMSFAEFNEYIDGYSAPVGTTPYGPGRPEIFTVWNNQITLFPTPNADLANGLTIYYIKHPVAVATLADSLGIPLQYHNAVVDYCLKQAYEMDEDAFKASLKSQEFDAKVQELTDRNKWISQEYYPRITTLPEDESFGSFGYWGFV